MSTALRYSEVRARRSRSTSFGSTSTNFSSGVILKSGWPFWTIVPSPPEMMMSSIVPENGARTVLNILPHPWKELLAGRPAPRLPLADCVPPDRALLYLPQPKEAVDGLEHGAAGFLQRVSSFAGEGRLDYAIIERYLEDLGLGDGLGRKLLTTGAVKEALI